MNAIAMNAARSAEGASVVDGALRVESIGKTYPARGRELVILRGVSLTMSAGDSAAVMGPSGSGKSTLLNILGTLEPPTSGRVTIGGTDPFTLDERGLARFRNRTIGFIFQEHHLLPQCTVLENVLLPTLAGPREGGASALDRARQLLDRVAFRPSIIDRLNSPAASDSASRLPALSSVGPASCSPTSRPAISTAPPPRPSDRSCSTYTASKGPSSSSSPTAIGWPNDSRDVGN